ncbi:outer membrane protein assembly factor BamA [Oceaniglobus roseus]|uniref:outer membrane protein assembly factor BamA n=1 Tax=Oceaniglobus roseus TaxID=1737570 RepID=UPI000C7F5C2D|nr:outer membrane protein assembly factor BamA [Kandeliimicrobium roseum]
MGTLGGGIWRRGRTAATAGAVGFIFLLSFLGFTAALAPEAQAQSYRFNTVQVEGNQRVEPATIISYAGIGRGDAVSAAGLNDAYQRIVNSGLFETVEIVPQGGTLVIRVQEYPTISRINIEGNRRIKDEELLKVVTSTARRVYNPTQAEQDAAAIAELYQQRGRLAASVTPKIIRRSENRVDLVFEVAEGRVTETQRVSFVGNRTYSDGRLRRVLSSKQAGFLRAIVQSDTFIADRLELDKQLLRDFYTSRGFVDFKILSVNSEFARDRNGFFVTFNVQEGQPYKFGQITASTEVPGLDAQEYLAVAKVRPGQTYSPVALERDIQRMETLALQRGLNFIRVDPRVTRDDRNLLLNIDYTLVRGPRIFVERIDIEGNQTTLDRVIRRQFKTVEGDPFNPREIRASAERIRALGYFSNAEVESRQGSAEDQVIIDVNVDEQPTGSLTFGAAYSGDSGIGGTIGFSEKNFLGRGQTLNLDIATATDTASSQIEFIEPAFLGRDLQFSFSAFYSQSNYANSFYDTRIVGFRTGFEFPVSENGRLGVRYGFSKDTIKNVSTDSSPILQNEAGALFTSQAGYPYSFDTRRTGLNPNAGILLRFSQDFAGLGGDTQYIKTTALASAQTKVLNEEVTLRATVEGGSVNSFGNTTTRLTDRFFLSTNKLRGFAVNGVGPRDTRAVNEDALGGNMYAVARLEAEFPLGIPEEYGISGGVFFDAGTVWGLDKKIGAGGFAIDDSAHLRSSIGVSVFWNTPIGPLRFNFAKALVKEDYDETQVFNLTISTQF